MSEQKVLNAPTTYPLKHDDGTTDKRYTIRPEFCGYEQPRYVLRYCGEYVANSISLSSMIMRAAGHRAVANGAEIITEQRS